MLLDATKLNAAAAVVYVIVAAAALVASALAKGRDRAGADWVRWLVIAGFFALLAASRLYGIEEGLRQSLRLALLDEGSYDLRREYQRPLAAAVVVVGAAAGFALAYRIVTGPRGRRAMTIAVAKLATAAMAVLIGLRVVSLHMVDAVLYGPPKLNWLIDMGSSLAVLGAAVVFCRTLLRTR